MAYSQELLCYWRIVLSRVHMGNFSQKDIYVICYVVYEHLTRSDSSQLSQGTPLLYNLNSDISLFTETFDGLLVIDGE